MLKLIGKGKETTPTKAEEAAKRMHMLNVWALHHTLHFG